MRHPRHPRRLAVAAIAFLIALRVPLATASDTAAWRSEQRTANESFLQRNYDEAVEHARRATELVVADRTATDNARVDCFNTLARIEYYRGDYAKAKQAAEHAFSIRERAAEDPHAIAQSAEDVAQLLDLQGKFAEAEAWHRRAAAGLAIVGRGTATSSALNVQGPIRQSVYELYDARHAEDPGYGRYTYLVLRAPNERNAALLASLLTTVPSSRTFGGTKARANVFELPLAAGKRDDAMQQADDVTRPATDRAHSITRVYDYREATDILTTATDQYHPPSGARLKAVGAGPYFIVFSRPVRTYSLMSHAHKGGPGLPQPYLIVDVSEVDPRAFPYFIKVMEDKLEAKSMADAERIDATRLAILTIALSASDWVDPVVRQVRDIMTIVK